MVQDDDSVTVAEEEVSFPLPSLPPPPLSTPLLTQFSPLAETREDQKLQ